MTEYRMLKEGEKIQEGDETYFQSSGWVKTGRAGDTLTEVCKREYRRPIDKKDDMDGWRMLKEGEVAEVGDEYRYNIHCPWGPALGVVGELAGSYSGEVRRKVEDTSTIKGYNTEWVWADDLADSASDPDHYKQGDIECIDYIKSVLTKEEYIGYLQGNITKYLHRWKNKNGVEDLDKAHVYLNWLIEEVEDGQEE